MCSYNKKGKIRKGECPYEPWPFLILFDAGLRRLHATHHSLQRLFSQVSLVSSVVLTWQPACVTRVVTVHVPSFIPKTAIESRVKEARLPDASHLVRGFASAVLALGAYYHHLYRRQHGDDFVAGSGAQKQNQNQKQHSCSRNGDGGDLDGAQASWRLRAALAFRGCVRGLPSQLLKLQVGFPRLIV